ncbi:hypothetical protein [Micromonospora chokoriensis]|uniref:hypothetical protein n=1 Tax=Micromonospora chokoriensis TaxID=356851 RepID=UPI00068F0487|nr:hypothetical protein [Micromonospora chokoriensis]
MTNEYGPDKTCQRTACATEPAHLGGEHIDPRSERYDGPSTTLNALGAGPRKAARALLAAGAPMPEVVDMAKEILRLKGQVAAEQVDKDRQVRAAGDRALDCTEHGKVIADLEKQVHHFDQRAAAYDKSRLTCVSGLHEIGEHLSALQAKAKQGGQLPSSKELVDALAKAVAKLSERGRVK